MRGIKFKSVILLSSGLLIVCYAMTDLHAVRGFGGLRDRMTRIRALKAEQECLEALIQQTEKACGELLDEGTLDGVFYDSVVGAATWLGEVDTNRDGVADLPAEVNARWQERQNRFFEIGRAHV